MRDGYGSKKFWFAIGVCLLGFVYCLIAVHTTELKGMFDGFTGLLEFVTGAYLTGNIANKWVVGKAESDMAKVVPPAKPKDPLDKDVPGAGV